MVENSHQPQEYDAVLSGLERIKQLLTHGRVEQKVDALIDAFEYGNAGLDLIIQALQNSEVDVQEAAYWLLQESTEPRVKLALQAYNPYLLFEYLFTIEMYIDKIPGIERIFINPYKEVSVTVNDDGIVKIWNIQTQQFTNTWKQVKATEFTEVIITSDDQILGLWHCNDFAEVWDLKIGEKIFTTDHHADDFWHVSFSPDGQTLVSTGNRNMFVLWNIYQKQGISSIYIPEYLPRRYMIYYDSQNLVTYYIGDQEHNNIIELWDWQTAQVICRINIQSTFIPDVDISPDRRLLISNSQENGTAKVKVWVIGTGHELCSLITNLSFIDGRGIGSDEQRLFAWFGGSTVTAHVWGYPSSSGRVATDELRAKWDRAQNFVKMLAII